MAAQGCDVAALNCGTGVDMRMAAQIVRRYRATSGLPVMAQPNAGQPVLENMQVLYKETPEEMAAGLPALLAAGPRIVGGCCGSTPAHIRRLRQVLDAAASARQGAPHESHRSRGRGRWPTPTCPEAKPDGSGVGVNYADQLLKPFKLTLADGRKMLLKRRGLKLTLAIGDKQGEAILRRLDHGPDVKVIFQKALEDRGRGPLGHRRLRAGSHRPRTAGGLTAPGRTDFGVESGRFHAIESAARRTFLRRRGSGRPRRRPRQEWRGLCPPWPGGQAPRDSGPSDAVGLVAPATAVSLGEAHRDCDRRLRAGPRPGAAPGHPCARPPRIPGRPGPGPGGRPEPVFPLTRSIKASPRHPGRLGVGPGPRRYLDWDALTSWPKVVAGYSDITALHCAIAARTGLVSFHALGIALVGRGHDLDAVLVEDVEDVLVEAGVEPRHLGRGVAVDVDLVDHAEVAERLLEHEGRGLAQRGPAFAPPPGAASPPPGARASRSRCQRWCAG